MARFYTACRGDRGEATRTGHHHAAAYVQTYTARLAVTFWEDGDLPAHGVFEVRPGPTGGFRSVELLEIDGRGYITVPHDFAERVAEHNRRILEA